ncbi:MAG: class II aldolase/adducin family protein [Bacteroidia bacterium]|nr:MAG: class II aldolase/adducin family protein [Bacteroidia bacterium]
MEGVVKFNCHWTQTGSVITDEPYAIMNYWREVLFNMDLIGAYENGVGFGNISQRIGTTSKFFITASATGEISFLEPGHYVKVESYNFRDNAVKCVGPLKASSESLTHAAIYQADPGTNAIIHIHSMELWENLKDIVPTTGSEFEYGTTGLAMDVFRLFNESDVIEKRIIVMGGDPSGIIAFGNDMDEAINILMSYIGEE